MSSKLAFILRSSTWSTMISKALTQGKSTASDGANDIAMLNSGRHVDLQRSQARRQLLNICLIVLLVSPIIDAANWFVTHRWSHAQHPSVMYYAYLWATSWTHGSPTGDSWNAMRAALTWIQQHPGGRLCEQLFFIEHVKFQYPPSSLLPLHFLTLLGLAPTNAGLNEFNSWCIALDICALAAVAFILAARSTAYAPLRWHFAILSAIGALLFYPLLRGFVVGQVQVWINALFALAALAWVTGKKPLTGVLIALICLLKPQFGLFLLWGLLRREWGFVLGWAIVMVVASIASIAVFGLQNHIDYLAVLSALSRTGEAFTFNQSLNGLLNRLYAVDDPMVWQPHRFPPYNPVVHGGTLVFSVVLVGMSLLLPLRGKERSGLIDFVGAALAFTLASPLAWDHHYGILPAVYIALLFVFLNRSPSRARSWALAILTGSFLITAHWLGSSWTFCAVLLLFGLVFSVICVRHRQVSQVTRSTTVLKK